MNIFFTFILGVLLGWLVEWAIDFIYWRNRFMRGEARLVQSGLSAPDAARTIQPTSDMVTSRDDLKIIKGIGVVIEGKLNDAGVYTFEQLANLSVSELRQILGKVIERLSDEDSLLAQARQLARGRA